MKRVTFPSYLYLLFRLNVYLRFDLYVETLERILIRPYTFSQTWFGARRCFSFEKNVQCVLKSCFCDARTRKRDNSYAKKKRISWPTVVDELPVRLPHRSNFVSSEVKEASTRPPFSATTSTIILRRPLLAQLPPPRKRTLSRLKIVRYAAHHQHSLINLLVL